MDKRRTFMQTRDYLRFVHDIFEFNDTHPASNVNYYFGAKPSAILLPHREPRELLVEVLCFCLMPNHYHFLLRQRQNHGISEFMRKIGTGYTNYFNEKYDRSGALFQGKFKAIRITAHAHLLYLPHYIHLNPLDLIMPEWREQNITNAKKALRFLASYRWSSYADFIGKRNFPSLTQRDFLHSIYGSRTSINYKKDFEAWVRHLDLDAVKDVIME
ncbi:MAG: transposase [Patescibacteria group bacterium]